MVNHWNSESVINPAESVEDFRSSPKGCVTDALDWFAKKVEGSDEDTRGEEEGRCKTIMKSEDGVVNHCLVLQVANFEEGSKSGQILER